MSEGQGAAALRATSDVPLPRKDFCAAVQRDTRELDRGMLNAYHMNRQLIASDTGNLESFYLTRAVRRHLLIFDNNSFPMLLILYLV